MRILAVIVLSLMLNGSCLAELSSNTMVKIRVNNVISGFDAKQVTTVYRLGNQYGRVEEPAAQSNATGRIVVVSEPDIWVIDPKSGTGTHTRDEDPDGSFKMPIVPVESLADLEFGTEFEFFEKSGGVRKSKVKKENQEYDRYSLVVEDVTIAMLADAGTRIPRRISVLYGGATALDYIYLEYTPGMKADLSLFKPAAGLKLVEMKPEGLQGRDSPLPLANATALEMPGPKQAAELKRKWNAFQHESYDVSGACHLTLPFQYETQGGGDTNEANAFAFLLSNSLDWYPGSYCARHAYFVFKRSGEDIIDAGKTLNGSLITKLAQRWNATHVISGKLIHGKDGYRAVIKIFDSNARLLNERAHEKPKAYFELLGDVCIGIMQQLGHEPSPALQDHLKMVRCKNHESIIDLGKAAFAEERSAYEFGLYEAILKRDPGFADVLYWWANQRNWKDHDDAAYDRDVLLSLKSYLVEASVSSAMPEDSATVETVRKLMGDDAPLVVSLGLKHKMAGQGLTSELVERGVRSAEKYPNDRRLLMDMIEVFERRGAGLADCDMIISMVLTSLENRHMVGSESQTRSAVRRMADALMDLGHVEEAAGMYQWNLSSALRDEDQKAVDKNAGKLGEALRRMGLLSDAYQVHQQAWQMAKDEQTRGFHLARACLLGAIMGETEKVSALLADHLSEVSTSGWLPLIRSYLAIIQKKSLDEGLNSMVSRNEEQQREAVLLLAQSDVVAGTTAYRAKLEEYMGLYPDDREVWIVNDAYNRIKEGAGSAFFYGSLSLLHGSDPWVKEAVQRYRERGGTNAVVDLDKLDGLLKDCKPIRWPTLESGWEKTVMPDKNIPVGAVALAADAWLKQGQKSKAKELVLKYQYYAAHRAQSWVLSNKQYALRARCNHLYHLIDGAKDGGSLGLADKQGAGASDSQVR